MEALLTEHGFSFVKKSSKTFHVKTNECRIATKERIINTFKGAVDDPNLPGSSIGGIRFDNYKIFIKADGATGGLDKESHALNKLRQSISDAMKLAGCSITVVMDHRSVDRVIDAEKTKGTPKSDFHCINEDLEPVIFISHKAGNKPSHFQQWSGVTEENIANNAIVKTFTDECYKLFGTKIQKKESFAMRIPECGEGTKLRLMSVFGTDAPEGKPGINCVDVVVQGDITLEQIEGKNFRFVATGHLHYYPDVPKEGYEPVLAMIYKGDRSNLGISGARASIYPKEGRKFARKSWD